MTFEILYEPNPNPDDIQVLNNGIAEHTKQKKELDPLNSFAYFIRDQDGKITGGCAGTNLYGSLYIDQLWLNENLRGKGYGTKLLQEAENFAKNNKCSFMAVNTFDWEALDFYKKLGFTVEFERRGFLKDSVFYFLRKDLIPNITNHVIDTLDIATLNESHIDEIVSSFNSIGWTKPRSIYKSYILEQKQNLRSIFLAKVHGRFCGYVTIKWKSNYEPFDINNIPEISDLNVLPTFRNNGIGTLLVQQCENAARQHGHTEIGIGVGMTRDYGNAQRLYARLGFVPDGNGLHYKYKAANYSETVKVDDDLVLYLKKMLGFSDGKDR
jgi:ribosomal protein S18 acetylase RimI-like enzyme